MLRVGADGRARDRTVPRAASAVRRGGAPVLRVAYDIVIPTIGRPSLARLLARLGEALGPLPERITVVDDRADAREPLALELPPSIASRVDVLRSGGRGPAAARNVGWRAGRARWVAFLDDDIEPSGDWAEMLTLDLKDLPDDVGGSQGRIAVPLPADRPATDWERNVAGLASARWITADMAYRREALERVGGFDETFPAAYREDADLAARVRQAGYRLVCGERCVLHPVRPAGRWVSVRLQRGNADDVWMRLKHGRRWRERTEALPGRRRAHAVTAAAGVAALAAGVARNRTAAIAAGSAWVALTADFAARRIAPGPRTREEVTTMIATSTAIPFVATAHYLRGWLRYGPRALRRSRA